MIEIPASIGELVDKITILKIKSKKIIDDAKLNNIQKELDYLSKKYDSLNVNAEVKKLESELYEINLNLWEIEDILRGFEREKNFGSDFIQSARSVYKLNDQRFVLKSKINFLTNSSIIEEKSYKEY
jgi:hypothetical protein